MFGAVRVGDKVKSTCKGKPSGPFISGSKTTFIDNRCAVRVGDKSLPGRALTGSKTTFIDNRPAVRMKDKVKCGIIKTSSKTTIIR